MPLNSMSSHGSDVLSSWGLDTDALSSFRTDSTSSDGSALPRSSTGSTSGYTGGSGDGSSHNLFKRRVANLGSSVESSFGGTANLGSAAGGSFDASFQQGSTDLSSAGSADGSGDGSAFGSGGGSADGSDGGILVWL